MRGDKFREAARSKEGDQALITGAKGLALTAFRLITETAILVEIKNEFSKRKEQESGK